MAQHDGHLADGGGLQGGVHQAYQFDIAGGSGVAEQLGSDSDGCARGAQPSGAGVEHAAAVAQAHRAVAVQAVGVDAGRLGGDVGAHAEHPSAQLVGDFDGVEVKVAAGAHQQGVEVFHERGDDEAVAPGGVEVENVPPQELQPCGLLRQKVFHTVRKKPAFGGVHFGGAGLQGGGAGVREAAAVKAGLRSAVRPRLSDT